jgi:D-sedoheptulose 7-phosphate isomerase
MWDGRRNGSSCTEVRSTTSHFLGRLTEALGRLPSEPIERAIEILLEARAQGRRVYVFGNGGSASTASHLVCDLAKGAAVDGHPPLRVFALSDNIPLVTAWANDLSYERVFAEQVAGLVEPGDVVIAISASGRSPNVVAALSAAAERETRIVGLLGFDGGPALDLVDVAIHVPCEDYGIVETIHLAVVQALALGIRTRLTESQAAPEPLVT